MLYKALQRRTENPVIHPRRSFAKKVNGFNPYSPMMEFFYKMWLSEDFFNKMNIFGFIFEKEIKFGPKIPKYLFVSLN